MMESIMQVAAETAPQRRKVFTGPRDAALRAGRTCYDHLAGHLGVSLTDAMLTRGHIEFDVDAGVVTAAGMKLFERLGLDLGESGKKKGRMLCRPCLDWSERRPHLAGAIGTALCKHCFDAGWIKRVEGTRAVTVTVKGQRGLWESFGIGAA
jgi:hypothetical protein